MPYTITNIEVTQPLPTLLGSENDTGIALILRRQDRPIGFLMKALPAKSVLTPFDLAQLISQEVGTKLLQESIREELVPTTNQFPPPSLSVPKTALRIWLNA